MLVGGLKPLCSVPGVSGPQMDLEVGEDCLQPLPVAFSKEIETDTRF